MKTGIVGGTFNPFHLGHLHLALEVRSKLGLDEILFIPAGNPPHKTDEELASPADRFEMVALAISDYPFFKLSDFEIKRTGKSYSIDTVKALKKSRPADEFFFIIGLDAFMEIKSWKDSLLLLQSIHFIIVSRPGYQFVDLTRLPFFKDAPGESLHQLDHRRINHLELHLNDFPAMILLHIDPWPVSSSEIRQNFKLTGQIGNNLLPEQVKSFIIKKKIF
ncbi:MAG: nicotinate-nucleotide adenylyltransferase [Nitrospiria bacterium]